MVFPGLKNVISTSSGRLIHMSLGYDRTLASINYLSFKAVVVDSSVLQRTIDTSKTQAFASDILILTLQGSDQPISSGNSYTFLNQKVENLGTPFKFTMPLVDTSEDTSTIVKQCVYFNSTYGNWTALECPSVRINSTTMQCCANHFTQFAVMSVATST